VTGAVVIAAIAGAAATLLLLALGVPYALPIGLIVTLLDPIRSPARRSPA
jgi:predicted PurR-regulated permease PerM